MAGEPNQIKWVGIRPTNPPEDIPVTTKKVSPAVSDLQAVKENISGLVSANNQDCSVSKVLTSGVMTGTYIWVITTMVMYNTTSLCDMNIKARTVGGTRGVKRFNSYEPGVYGSWDGLMVLVEGDYIAFEWVLGGVTDDLVGIWHGYKIGVY